MEIIYIYIIAVIIITTFQTTCLKIPIQMNGKNQKKCNVHMTYLLRKLSNIYH